MTSKSHLFPRATFPLLSWFRIYSKSYRGVQETILISYSLIEACTSVNKKDTSLQRKYM